MTAGVPITIDAEDVGLALIMLVCTWLEPDATEPDYPPPPQLQHEDVGALMRLAQSVDLVDPLPGRSRTEMMRFAVEARRRKEARLRGPARCPDEAHTPRQEPHPWCRGANRARTTQGASMNRRPGDARLVEVTMTVEGAALAAILLRFACDALDPGGEWTGGIAPLLGVGPTVCVRSDIERARTVGLVIEKAITYRDDLDAAAAKEALRRERAEDRARKRAEKADRAGQDALTPAESPLDTAPL